jgi:hypothetical protein
MEPVNKWTAFILIVLSIAIAGRGHAFGGAPENENEPARRYQHGWASVETYHGVYFVHLYGDPYEMGYQQGAMLKDELHQFRNDCLDYLNGYASRYFGLPEWLVRPFVRPVVTYWTRQLLPGIPETYIREMEGMADASGLPFIEIAMLNAIWELAELHACSEFAVTSPATKDGKLWHGYNFDLMDPDQDFIDPYKAVIFYHPEGRKSFVSVTYIGYVGVWTGMNQAGISLAWDNTVLKKNKHTRAELKKAKKYPEPFVFAIRRVMEEAGDIDRAVEIMSDLKRPLGDIVIIASRDEDRAVAVETFSTKTVVREMKESAIWSANCFASKEMGVFDHGQGKIWLWSAGEMSGDDPVFLKRSYSRHLRYSEVIRDRYGDIGLDEMVDILRDPYPLEARGGSYDGERTIAVDRTNFSVVYNLSDMALWAALGRTPSPFDIWVGVDFATEKPLDDDKWPALIPATALFDAREGYLAMEEEDYPAAVAAFERALAVEPGNHRVQAWRLHALYQSGDMDELPPLPPPFRAMKVPGE